jgi:hypothetical protein
MLNYTRVAAGITDVASSLGEQRAVLHQGFPRCTCTICGPLETATGDGLERDHKNTLRKPLRLLFRWRLEVL